MKPRIRLFAVLLVATAVAPPAGAAIVTVGSGSGCQQPTLQAAFNVISNQPGDHTIRIRTGAYAIPDGISYGPTVGQGTVWLEGGYANCTDDAPSGDPNSDAGRAVFNAAGGLPRSAWTLKIVGRVGSVQIRRIAITGGDAFNANESINAGGGLAIHGPASVLLGRGASIRNNGAGRGGGVALIGGPVRSGSVIDKVDFYLTEFAEIVGNGSANEGGGIYCGGALDAGQPAVDRHGTIVMVDGLIANNSGGSHGGAFYCLGSVEGGGGFQPRPGNGQVAWLFNNTTGWGSCGAGYGTLDAAIPLAADGFRPLGAPDNSNGMLAITHNHGLNPALCLDASYQLGTSNQPEGPSRFRLQNLVVTGQRGSGDLGLRLDDQAITLRVKPSGTTTSCEFFNPVSCVSFTDNHYEDTGNTVSASLGAWVGRLELVRAEIRHNTVVGALFNGVLGARRLESSLIADNTVLTSEGGHQSAFVLHTSASIELVHTTVSFDTPLAAFFDLDQPSSTASVQASVLTSNVTPAPLIVTGAAGAATRFTRKWCGFFQTTEGFPAHVQIPDPTTGTFNRVSGGDPGLAPGSFTPGDRLVDGCTPSVATDFHGQPFGVVRFPGSPPADIGAVENPRADLIFANGFQ